MASCAPFKVAFNGQPQDIYNRVKAMIDGNGGTLEGDTQSGRFSVSVPVFGTVKGEYTIVGKEAVITVTERSPFLACQTIENFIRKNLDKVDP
ncbi:hypothetical protein KCM76_19670 [Zooshikella marina]|uniref:Uncharacterized protein n=1 Tax=Zooshikella ganghwensis TaxID=202772 RepID=A0A4P9VFY5_9GAMM|nr:hypothetical protein [Zooshikella ganghwensis]MBU2708221.1 hypothetical protein [Zooshikella ganghwensis]RDH42038.1 hypothetical protein B9G39_00480 [Zooshikella ganghwensis]